MTIKDPLKKDWQKKRIKFNTQTNKFEVLQDDKGKDFKCSTSPEELKFINDYRQQIVKDRAIAEGKPEEEIRKQEIEKISTQLQSDWKYAGTKKLSGKMDKAEAHMAIDDKKVRQKAIKQLLNYVKKYDKHVQFFFKLFKKLEY